MTTVEQPLTETEPPSVTTWTRLEPRTRRADLAPAVDARIADPLWLLARQWQLGEFTGEDAGSPVAARVHAEVARFTRYRPGPAAGAVGLPAGVPWEALVEREVAATADDLRFAVESGQQLLRLLADAHAGGLAPRLCDTYRVPATPPDGASAADPATVGYLRIAAGRVPHGGLALRAWAEGRFIREVQVPDDLVAAVNRAVADWLAWLGAPPRPAGPPPGYLLQLPAVLAPGSSRPAAPPWPPADFTPLFSAPGLEGSAWRRERMEYEAAVAAHDGQAELVLTAHEYDGNRLDWYHFDHEPGTTLEARKAVDDVVKVLLPSPVAYAGMPSTRFWELEDAQVNLAGIGAGAGDLARMFVVEYGLVYANDHFLLPLELPVGSATRIRSLLVTDTFGGQTLVPAAPESTALFRPAAADGRGATDVLVLPATAAATLDSAPVEEVRLGRDETANLAWAVERTVTGVTGRPIDRTAQVGRAAVSPRPPVAADAEVPALSYAFATTVPENWVPLLPGPTQDRPDVVRLRRVPLQQPSRDGEPVAVTGYSRLLDWRERDGRLVELAFPEEEVPRAGSRVLRQWQLARWTDGSVHLWLGRARHVGAGEISSGLRYDTVQPR
ncbi:hypothetical protein ONA91_19980 [Micromonospora sp. DR5-3]|uniref:hypothetical protein n=1 Tax=unclassified Micromonospora TaxID=2617518 RepID=UPI0011DA795B|nr:MULTISPECIES: hypothetical protein [unclassified Micromonospora]MCW3816729.1 hypothetical protein [Micromonospora sp. DR5-3]TYC20691.1 hypothetical protein FXF52_30025 [Micromonospora sp. MP36]